MGLLLTRRLPIVIGLVQLAGLVSGATLADRLGRRPLLLCSCALAALGLTLTLTLNLPLPLPLPLTLTLSL